MPRRSNGEGTWRKRKDDTWELRVVVGTKADGTSLRKSFYGRTQKECRDKRDTYNAGSVKIEKVATVGEWATKWLEVYKKDSIAYKSYISYKGYVKNHITPDIGGLKLEQVRPAHLKEFLTSKSDKSWAMRRDLLIILRGMFETAMDNRLCSSNPALLVDIGKKPRGKPQVFSRGDIARILKFAPAHRWGHYVELLLYTGLRTGDAYVKQKLKKSEKNFSPQKKAQYPSFLIGSALLI